MELAIIAAAVVAIFWALAWVAVRTDSGNDGHGKHEKRGRR